MTHSQLLRKQRADALWRKFQVLSHYSPGHILGCSWPDCKVTDLQMLSLDHVNGDGAEHRRRLKSRSSSRLYREMIREGYPPHYQTLCGSHQLKKEIQRRIRARCSGVDDGQDLD